jgi:hypothetical protein
MSTEHESGTASPSRISQGFYKVFGRKTAYKASMLIIKAEFVCSIV